MLAVKLWKFTAIIACKRGITVPVTIIAKALFLAEVPLKLCIKAGTS